MVQKIYIAGQDGMVGQAIYKLLKKNKYNVIDCERSQLDLTNQKKSKFGLKKTDHLSSLIPLARLVGY